MTDPARAAHRYDEAGVPPGLPVLSAGRHRDARRGACVMEYASLLAGEPWSDHPRCTDRTLAELARRVNDGVLPVARSALAPLAPRLVGAVGERPATDVVVRAVARAGLSVRPGDLMLLRTEQLSEERLVRDAADRPGSRWLRTRWWVVGALLGRALAGLDRVLVGRTRAERDALRVALLHTAVEDVRRHVGADRSTADGPSTAVVGGTP